METRYLKTLATAVEAGTFSRAAEILNITQSAVSQRIKFLEDQYGSQLLDRSGPTLVPTEAGRIVLKNARGILDLERDLVEELKRLRDEKRLSLCCTPTFGIAYLPRILSQCLCQNADLADLKFVIHQPMRAVKGLQEKEFDLAIIEHCCGLEFPTLSVQSLPQDELVFISSPALEIAESILPIDTLLPCRVYTRRDGCSSKQLLRHNLTRLGFDLNDFRSIVISDDLRLTIDAVLNGGGISYVSRSLVEDHLDSGRLRAHHVQTFENLRSRSILIPPAKVDVPILGTFIKCVLAVVGSETPLPNTGNFPRNPCEPPYPHSLTGSNQAP